MGVFLNLGIAPERISAEEWSAVYRETLVLLDEFPFLDRVNAENGYCYGAQSAHRENVLEGYNGWHVTGDVYDGCNIESFFLIDDISYYRKKVPCSVCCAGRFSYLYLFLIHCGQRQHNSKNKHSVLRFENATPSILFGNGLDAATTVAMTLPIGKGQAIPHSDFAHIGVFDLDEHLVRLYAAVKLCPFESSFQFRNCVKSVFQTVGQNGA